MNGQPAPSGSSWHRTPKVYTALQLRDGTCGTAELQDKTRPMRLSEGEVERFEERGYLFFPALFSAQEVEVLRRGVDGLLAPPRDEKALARAIRTLIEDPALRNQFGAAGRRNAEKYRWSTVASRVLEFYALAADRPELAGTV